MLTDNTVCYTGIISFQIFEIHILVQAQEYIQIVKKKKKKAFIYASISSSIKAYNLWRLGTRSKEKEIQEFKFHVKLHKF